MQNETVSSRQWLAVFGAILGAFMAVLDIQVTNASIQQITSGLSASLDSSSWISTAYLVGEIIIIPLSGWFARVFSQRNYMIVTTLLFVFFSICCGFSWNLSSMIVFRCLQGLTGGALIPLAFQTILSLPPSHRPSGFALFSVTAIFAPAIGPTIGGYLSETFSWTTIFFMNVGPGLITLILVALTFEKESVDLRLLKKIDVSGILSMSIGLASLTVFLEEGQKQDWFASSWITVLAITSVVFIITFIIIELVIEDPVINLRLLKQRNFGIGCLIIFVVGGVLYGALFLLPMYLVAIQNYGPVKIGETMMWAGFPQLLLIPFLPKIISKFDARWLTFAGLNIVGISCFMNSHLTILVGYDQLVWSQVVRALGQPLLMIPLSTVATGYILKEHSGSASGLYNMLRNLGGSVGIAFLSTALSVREQFHSARLTEGVTLYSYQTQARLSMLKAKFIASGFDPLDSYKKGLAVMAQTVHQQAYVMAFNDCFLATGAALVLGSIFILCARKVQTGASPEASH